MCRICHWVPVRFAPNINNCSWDSVVCEIGIRTHDMHLCGQSTPESSYKLVELSVYMYIYIHIQYIYIYI